MLFVAPQCLCLWLWQKDNNNLCCLLYDMLTPSRHPREELPGFEKPSPVCPRKSQTGPGPSSHKSTCLAFNTYRNAAQKTPSMSLCKQATYPDMSQRFLGVYLYKQGTLAFPAYRDVPVGREHVAIVPHDQQVGPYATCVSPNDVPWHRWSISFGNVYLYSNALLSYFITNNGKCNSCFEVLKYKTLHPCYYFLITQPHGSSSACLPTPSVLMDFPHCHNWPSNGPPYRMMFPLWSFH